MDTDKLCLSLVLLKELSGIISEYWVNDRKEILLRQKAPSLACHYPKQGEQALSSTKYSQLLNGSSLSQWFILSKQKLVVYLK